MYEGLFYTETSKTPIQRVVVGYGGVFYTFPDAVSVKVVDKNGRGLSGVRVIAKNSSEDYEIVTGATGDGFMLIEDNTEVIVSKNSLTKTVDFVAGKNLIIEIDLPFIPN